MPMQQRKIRRFTIKKDNSYVTFTVCFFLHVYADCYTITVFSGYKSSQAEVDFVVKNRKKSKKQVKTAKNKEFLVIMYLFLAMFLGLMAYFVYFQVYKNHN